MGPARTRPTFDPDNPPIDISTRIQEAVGAAGKAKPTYGGFEIQVHEEAAFDFVTVLRLLGEVGHDVWVRVEGGRIVIRSKPPAI